MKSLAWKLCLLGFSFFFGGVGGCVCHNSGMNTFVAYCFAIGPPFLCPEVTRLPDEQLKQVSSP